MQNGRNLSLMFVPDIVLPDQWVTASNKQLTPEQGLCQAILEGAISDLELRATCNAGPKKHSRRYIQRRLQYEALLWIKEENNEHPFSFVNICQWLGLSPDKTRDALIRKYNEWHTHDLDEFPVGRRRKSHAANP